MNICGCSGTLLVALGIFAILFWPVTADAWREMTSGEFTAESAWWRARGLIRDQIKDGTHIRFDPFETAHVALQSNLPTSVVLTGMLTRPSGETERGAWRVTLYYDLTRGIWVPAPAPQTRR